MIKTKTNFFLTKTHIWTWETKYNYYQKVFKTFYLLLNKYIFIGELNIKDTNYVFEILDNY